MKKRLVMIDLDKTLIDRNYQVSVPNGEQLVAMAVQACRDQGIEVGLASDTALVNLQEWAVRFGMGGPLIGEFGACVGLSSGEILSTDERSVEIFSNLRQLLTKHLLADHSLGTILIGDNVALIREFGENSRSPLPRFLSGRMVLISGLRKCSISFYARRVREGQLLQDEQLLEGAINIVKHEIGELGLDPEKDFAFYDNPEYGICIVHLRETNKQLGFIKLMNSGDYEPTMAMIGDSMGDFIDHPKVVQCCVSNAPDVYQQCCQHIATQPMTAGVIELLHKLAEQPKSDF